jgi:hypothetical protein
LNENEALVKPGFSSITQIKRRKKKQRKALIYHKTLIMITVVEGYSKSTDFENSGTHLGTIRMENHGTVAGKTFLTSRMDLQK